MNNMEKAKDDIVEKNMKEQGSNDKEIEEFKKLKKYSSDYRLKHVYRQFNEFKY